jgi:hypothetical protein
MAAAAGSSDGVVKHLLLARFKEEVTTERLDGLIRRYAALVDTVPSMKAFHWYAHPSLILASSHILASLLLHTAGARRIVCLVLFWAVNPESSSVCGH